MAQPARQPSDTQLALYRSPDYVVKQEAFLDALYDWSVSEQRVVLYLIAQLDPTASDFGWQSIDVGDFVRAMGKTSGQTYDNVRDAADALLGKRLYLKHEDEEGTVREVEYNVMSACEWIGRSQPGVDRVRSRFNPDMKPLLLGVHGMIAIRYKELAFYQSTYTIRISERCRYWAGKENMGMWKVNLSDLRERLAIEDKYPRMADLRRRVFDQAAKEMNANPFCSFNVTYELKRAKGSRQYTYMVWRMTPRNPPPRIQNVGNQAQLAQSPENRRKWACKAWFDSLGDLERQEQWSLAVQSLDADDERIFNASPVGESAERVVMAKVYEHWDRLGCPEPL